MRHPAPWVHGRVAGALLAFALGLAGCSGGGGAGTTGQGAGQDLGRSAADEVGFSHVHGLGVNPADGALFAATHFGVWRVPTTGTPERVADRYQDTMGFTVAGADHFLASGHPDQREGLPAHLGLIESRDAARTWQPLSLLGGADFHALAAVGRRVYGSDATAGLVRRSDDGGRTWAAGAREPLAGVTADPAQPDTVLATSRRGLLRSTDAAATFTPVAGAPALLLVDWSRAGVVGLDVGGAVWHSPDGQRWERRGAVPGQPEALAAEDDGSVYVAVADNAVMRSTDGGRTFAAVVRYTGAHP